MATGTFHQVINAHLLCLHHEFEWCESFFFIVFDLSNWDSPLVLGPLPSSDNMVLRSDFLLDSAMSLRMAKAWWIISHAALSVVSRIFNNTSPRFISTMVFLKCLGIHRLVNFIPSSRKFLTWKKYFVLSLTYLSSYDSTTAKMILAITVCRAVSAVCENCVRVAFNLPDSINFLQPLTVNKEKSFEKSWLIWKKECESTIFENYVFYVHLRFHRMRSTALSCQPKDTTARLLLTLPLIINEVAMYSKAKYQRPYYKNKRHWSFN